MRKNVFTKSTKRARFVNLYNSEMPRHHVYNTLSPVLHTWVGERSGASRLHRSAYFHLSFRCCSHTNIRPLPVRCCLERVEKLRKVDGELAKTSSPPMAVRMFLRLPTRRDERLGRGPGETHRVAVGVPGKLEVASPPGTQATPPAVRISMLAIRAE